MIRIKDIRDDLGDGVYSMVDELSEMGFVVNTRPSCVMNYVPETDMVICPWRKEKFNLSVLLKNFEDSKRVYVISAVDLKRAVETAAEIIHAQYPAVDYLKGIIQQEVEGQIMKIVKENKNE